MKKEKSMACKVKKIGEDKDGRTILEFSGDKDICTTVISSLVDKKGVVIELEEEE